MNDVRPVESPGDLSGAHRYDPHVRPRPVSPVAGDRRAVKLLSLSCNHCGAQLDVPEKTNYVTCTFCGTKLKVERSGGAAYTEALEQLAEDVGALKRQVEVDRLDREWQMRREELMVRSERGHVSVPTKGASIVGAVVVVVFGVFWTVFASTIAGPFGLFGLVFIAFGLFATIGSLKKADAYEREHADYVARRRQLMDEA